MSENKFQKSVTDNKINILKFALQLIVPQSIISIKECLRYIDSFL